jgi:hypothetical protein
MLYFQSDVGLLYGTIIRNTREGSIGEAFAYAKINREYQHTRKLIVEE